MNNVQIIVRIVCTCGSYMNFATVFDVSFISFFLVLKRHVPLNFQCFEGTLEPDFFVDVVVLDILLEGVYPSVEFLIRVKGGADR